MPQRDPFAGFPLSDLTEASSRKLDQRLFGPRRPAKEAPAQPTSVPEPPPPRLLKAPGAPTSTIADEAPTAKPVTALPSRFDLVEDAFRNATYRFSEKELNALEDLRMELHRQLDEKVTKNDIVRAALHMLFEDHALNASRSYVYKKIRRR